MDDSRWSKLVHVHKLAAGVFIASGWFVHASTVSGEDRPPANTTIQLQGIDLDGQLHRFGDIDRTKVVAFVFLSTECPISNSYLPLLVRLRAKYRHRGMELYGVVSDPSLTRAEAIAHRDKFGVSFPVLFDASGELRRSLLPTHTPHVFVLDDEGSRIYQGAIDDLYVELGSKKLAASKHYLAHAIEATIAGKPVEIRETKPVGCLLEQPPDKTQAGSVTFARDIAPIIQANCASCHRPGQAGPFSLLTYDDVSRHALQIADVTQTRYMPPWKPEPNFGRFLDERRLSARQIALIDVWAKTGKPEGDPADLPPQPTFQDGWQLGEPDLILKMPEAFNLPARGADIRQYFVIPMNLRENRLISAIDFQPGVPEAVHHASFLLDSTGTARKLDAADSQPGYRRFGGPGFFNTGTLRSWLPGMSPRHLPRGLGRPAPRGSDLIVQVHYQLTGKPERDQSSVGLYFAPRTARQFVVELLICNKRLEIPAGERRHLHRATYTLPVDTTLLDAAPHMHLLGREMKAVATLPDGTVEPLIWIKNWDFDWQGQYQYARAVELPKGTRIDVDAWYDNSATNPLNPNSPPKVVRWGEDSTDEMGICHFQCTCASLQELQALTDDHRKFLSDQPLTQSSRR